MADIEAGNGKEDSSGYLADESERDIEDPIVTRPLRPADLDEVKELQRQLFPVRYNDSFYNKLFSPGYFTLVGCRDASGEIITIASARIVDDNARRLDNAAAYIMTLGVKESHRRRNLGTRALYEILELVAEQTNAAVAQLHVKCDNVGAVAFYRRNGFVEQALCKEHYLILGTRYDALIFEFDLSALPSAANQKLSARVALFLKSTCAIL